MKRKRSIVTMIYLHNSTQNAMKLQGQLGNICIIVYKLVYIDWLAFFLAFDFCLFCVAIRFFIRVTTANDHQLRRISIPEFIHYIFCPIFILEKEPVYPFLMLSAKQGNYWYHFYNDLWYWLADWLGTNNLSGKCEKVSIRSASLFNIIKKHICGTFTPPIV